MNRVIVVPPLDGGLLIGRMFEDLREETNTTLLDSPLYFKTKVMKYIFELHTHRKIQKFINLPFKRMWVNKYTSSLLNLKYNLSDKYYVIVTNPASPYVSSAIMEKLRSLYNIKFILCFFDPLFATSSIDAFNRKEEYDMIYSFDKLDAEKYGFEYFFQCYSKLKYKSKESKSYDLYFVGRNKGRSQHLKQCIQKFKEHKISYNILIWGKEKIDDTINLISYPLKYEEILADIQNCNCIFELLQEKQNGTTARYLEAVIYNKKLLTNNPEIKNYPFYNAQYMKVFDNISNVDFEWIRKRETIDYGYNNEFSPKHLINSFLEKEQYNE